MDDFIIYVTYFSFAEARYTFFLCLSLFIIQHDRVKYVTDTAADLFFHHALIFRFVLSANRKTHVKFAKKRGFSKSSATYEITLFFITLFHIHFNYIMSTNKCRADIAYLSQAADNIMNKVHDTASQVLRLSVPRQ